jgi:hypothetical protein
MVKNPTRKTDAVRSELLVPTFIRVMLTTP